MTLLHLSLRRVGNHAHRVPAPPSNDERVAAYRAFAPRLPNNYPWAWTERERYAREAMADSEPSFSEETET